MSNDPDVLASEATQPEQTQPSNTVLSAIVDAWQQASIASTGFNNRFTHGGKTYEWIRTGSTDRISGTLHQVDQNGNRAPTISGAFNIDSDGFVIRGHRFLRDIAFRTKLGRLASNTGFTPVNIHQIGPDTFSLVALTGDGVYVTLNPQNPATISHAAALVRAYVGYLNGETPED